MDPWHVVVVLATAIATGLGILYRAFLKGDVVAGSTHRQALKGWADERKARMLAERRADKAETQAERNTVSLEKLARQRDRPGPADG